MPASELQIGNRTAYFRKAIRTPNFSSDRVLARDAFQFAELWLKRECPKALPYWQQARSYYVASRSLPARSSPLTSYYCFLNAAKTLLTVKNVPFSDHHGVTGTFDPLSKRVLSNEMIAFKGGGILPALSRYLEEEETEREHTLTAILSNLPSFIVLIDIHSVRTRNCSSRSDTSFTARETMTTSGLPPILRAVLRTAVAWQPFQHSLRSTTDTRMSASSVLRDA
jgi:YaaC-like Protein